MVEYLNSAPMFQLAFGLNAVFGYWVWKFFETKRELLAAFEDKAKTVETHICNDSEEIEIAVMNYLQEFTGVRSFGIKFVVINSIISILMCFMVLLWSGLDPQGEFSAWVFVCLSIWFVLVNPLIYFVSNLRFNKVLSDALSNIESMNIDKVKDILFQAQGSSMQKFVLTILRRN